MSCPPEGRQRGVHEFTRLLLLHDPQHDGQQRRLQRCVPQLLQQRGQHLQEDGRAGGGGRDYFKIEGERHAR